jgi:predicted nucleotidyltransferase
VQVEGHQKYYQANAASPVFHELVGVVRKTVGLADPLRPALSLLGDRVRAAFVYGSVAAGEEGAESDIDLMVIADDPDYAALFEVLAPVERKLGRTVNANLMSLAEWRRKRSKPGGFAARLREGPRLFVVGSEDDLA